jgi:hypothetical protein
MSLRLTRWRITTAAIGIALAQLPLFAVASAQPLPDNKPSLMRLDVDTLTPRVITASTPLITVTGKVTNTGDRRIDDIQVQLKRGEPLNTEQTLADARNQPTDTAWSSFVPVSNGLEPGESAPVTITVQVRDGERSLRLDKPGVYPMLVNINGRPEYGGRARLTAVSVLLPALGVPGGDNTPAPPTPSPLTVLWPLIDDHPRNLGIFQDRALLADDELAISLAPGGRLFGLLSSVAQAAATDPGLLDALCFAVDPDLLETAGQMADGYRVRTGSGQVVEGKGAAAAKTWLDRLRMLIANECVIAVPYADADLVALSRVGAVDLEKLAISSAATIADRLQLVAPLSGVHWPVGGTLDQRTVADLSAIGPTTVLVDGRHLRRPEGSAPFTVGGGSATGVVRAVPIDAMVSAHVGNGQGYVPTGPTAAPADDRQVTVQNGLAALAYRTAFAGDTASPILIAPPRRWAAPANELGVFLQTLQYVFANRLAEPQPLAETLTAGQRGTATGLDYTAEDGSAEITPSVTSEVVQLNAAQRDLLGSMGVDDTAPVDPRTLVAPIQHGLLRATSSAWRGRELANQAVIEVGAQLDALRGQVTVTDQGRPFTMASGNSPIPVLLSNSLPVSVRVRITVTETPGLRPGPIPEVIIPARLSINRYLPAEVIRAGKFTVDVSLSTPGGTRLGSTARVELTSTSYGSITLIVTGTAAGALFLLAGLRIFRRVRSAGAAPAAEAPPIEDGAD